MSEGKLHRFQIVEVVGPDWLGNEGHIGRLGMVLTKEPDTDGDWTVSVGDKDMTFPEASLSSEVTL